MFEVPEKIKEDYLIKQACWNVLDNSQKIALFKEILGDDYTEFIEDGRYYNKLLIISYHEKSGTCDDPTVRESICVDLDNINDYLAVLGGFFGFTARDEPGLSAPDRGIREKGGAS